MFSIEDGVHNIHRDTQKYSVTRQTKVDLFLNYYMGVCLNYIQGFLKNWAAPTEDGFWNCLCKKKKRNFLTGMHDFLFSFQNDPESEGAKAEDPELRLDLLYETYDSLDEVVGLNFKCSQAQYNLDIQTRSLHNL